MSRIGQIIMEARNARHLTQAQLARKLGVTKQTISNYENGVRTPDLDMLEQLAEAFNLSFSDFVHGLIDGQTVEEARQELFDDPNRKALLDFARHGSPEAVRQAAAVIDALRATNPEYYDGDDPA